MIQRGKGGVCGKDGAAPGNAKRAGAYGRGGRGQQRMAVLCKAAAGISYRLQTGSKKQDTQNADAGALNNKRIGSKQPAEGAAKQDDGAEGRAVGFFAAHGLPGRMVLADVGGGCNNR